MSLRDALPGAKVAISNYQSGRYRIVHRAARPVAKTATVPGAQPGHISRGTTPGPPGCPPGGKNRHRTGRTTRSHLPGDNPRTPGPPGLSTGTGNCLSTVLVAELGAAAASLGAGMSTT